MSTRVRKQLFTLPEFRITRSEWWLVGVVLFFCLLFTVVELNNHRLWTNDLRVYYEAARAFFSGNDPYGHAYGLTSGFFKYPPFTLYLLSPIVFLPYGAAQLIHLALLTVSLAVCLLSVRRFVSPENGGRLPIGLSYLAFACIAIHVTRELHLGNINLLLLTLFCLGVHAMRRGKDYQLAIYWSLMLILKPIMLPVVAPLVLMRKWNVLIRMACLGVAFALFPMLHVGWSGMLALWQHWFDAISAHGSYLSNFNAVDAIALHLGFRGPQIFGLLFLLVLLALLVREQLKAGTSRQAFTEWAAVLAAFVPNLFVTDTEHFLLSLPLIFLLLCRLRNRRKWYLWGVFIIGMVCFSFNSTDLLGSALSDIVFRHGLLGIGNLLFIGLFVGMKLNEPLQVEPRENNAPRSCNL